MKLCDRIPFEKAVIADGVHYVSAKESMQMAEELQSQQTHHVIQGAYALPRSPSISLPVFSERFTPPSTSCWEQGEKPSLRHIGKYGKVFVM